MKLTKSKALIIIIISTISCFFVIFIHAQVSAPTQKITVDVERVLANFAHNPIGLNLNFLLDKETIIEPAQKLKLGSLRYPMGEIADYYLFDRNHPDKPKISIQDSSLWFAKFTNADGTWKNPLDFERFVNICHSLNAEPFVVVGIDALAYRGTSPHATFDEVLQAAVDWVKYANIVRGSNIKHWEIGNENDLPSNHLNWTAENYAQTVVKFSRAMKQVDPSIKIGVNGMRNPEWWDRVIPIVKDDVDFLVTHQYSSMQNYNQWSSSKWNFTHNLEVAERAIKKYNPTLRLNVTENSSLSSKQADEFNTNNIWKMLHNFEMLGNILCFDTLDYSHFWISRWFAPNAYSTSASAFDRDYKLMPMADSLKIWGNFIHQQMVFTNNQTGTIRSWASYDPQNSSLSLFLLNKALQPQRVTVTLENYDGGRKSRQWILFGDSPYETEPIWQHHKNPELLKNSQISLELRPLSATAIAFEK